MVFTLYEAHQTLRRFHLFWPLVIVALFYRFLCSNQLFFHSRYSQATTSTCGRWCVTTNLNCSNSYTNLCGLTTSPCEIQSLIAPLSCQRDLLVCFVFTWFVGGNSAKKSRKKTWEMESTCTWNGLWPTLLEEFLLHLIGFGGLGLALVVEKGEIRKKVEIIMYTTMRKRRAWPWKVLVRDYIKNIERWWSHFFSSFHCLYFDGV